MRQSEPSPAPAGPQWIGMETTDGCESQKRTNPVPGNKPFAKGDPRIKRTDLEPGRPLLEFKVWWRGLFDDPEARERMAKRVWNIAPLLFKLLGYAYGQPGREVDVCHTVSLSVLTDERSSSSRSSTFRPSTRMAGRASNTRKPGTFRKGYDARRNTRLLVRGLDRIVLRREGVQLVAEVRGNLAGLLRFDETVFGSAGAGSPEQMKSEYSWPLVVGAVA